MDQRQDMSPEMQIFLIASDVDEVKTMVNKLDGTVSQIHIALVGEKDKAGVFEELRALRGHDHKEIAELRTEFRVYTAKAAGAMAAFIFVLEIALRLWPNAPR